MSTAADVLAELTELGDAKIAEHSLRFFKTGSGEYGEGDQFLGIRVPVSRKVARRWRTLPPREVIKLLRSPWHEGRLVALFILVDHYRQGDGRRREQIFRQYLSNVRYVNNWDLVDSSAHLIVGPQLQDRDRSLLDSLAKSDLLWERRIAVLACLHFIRQDDFKDILRLAKKLLKDEEDLMHKAVGWMLREVEKRDNATCEAFLQQHYQKMPRTMLRYTIERLPEKRRQAYLKGKV